MTIRILLALLLCAAGPAVAAEKGRDDAKWFAPAGKAPVPSTFDLGTKHESLGGIADFDVLVERLKALPPVKAPEPEWRNPLDEGPSVRSPLDDRLASTRSGSRDGCHAGSVCYGGAPRLRDTISNLFGD